MGISGQFLPEFEMRPFAPRWYGPRSNGQKEIQVSGIGQIFVSWIIQKYAFERCYII